MVDDDVRSFISQNLVDAGAYVLPQSSNMVVIRETKSSRRNKHSQSGISTPNESNSR